MVGLVEKIKPKEGTKLFFDNFFTSEGLLNEFKNKGLGGTGTVRENRAKKSSRRRKEVQWRLQLIKNLLSHGEMTMQL